jgi:hypothetical protein
VLTPKKMFRFGTQVFESTHAAHIRFSVTQITGASPAFFEFKVHVIRLDCPVLLGLDVLLAAKTHVDSETLQLRTDIWTAQLSLEQGHLFLQTPAELLYTQKELTRMHVALAHPSSDKLLQLLKVARPNDTAPDTLALLKEVRNSCRTCTLYGPPPHRVRSSMPEKIRFNHHLVLDLFHLSGDACLHIICKGTRFSATLFLPSKRTEIVWETFLRIWVLVHLVLPCVLTVDQGTELIASVFGSNCKAMGIRLIIAPVESHSSIGIVEGFTLQSGMCFKRYSRVRTKNLQKN